jgi:predicted Zn-dependent protease
MPKAAKGAAAALLLYAAASAADPARPVAQGPLTYEPVALAWTAAEVERVGDAPLAVIIERAARSGQLGCRSQCTRLQRVFEGLREQARAQSARAAAVPWTLIVVRLPDVEALALPGGQVVVSEDFVARRAPTDEALAFVLAHEMAHCVLEHERQALSFARQLLPTQVPRSVQDVYVELEFNFALLKALEPVLQQGELEADELGLLMASAAGYAPEAQLRFLALEAAEPGSSERPPLLATHPNAPSRLAALRARLPLAERVFANRR